MNESGSKILWENAIIKVIEDCGGIATLKELYQIVPQIRKPSPHLDAGRINHIIRGYLTRMTRVKGTLKRIGLGLYALPDTKIQNGLIKNFEKGGIKKIIKEINDKDIHSYVEGMLIELGNVYGYLTYTADPSAVFNGVNLGKLASIDQFPNFTSTELLNIAKTIDVIWFRKSPLVAMPKHTFDIEITTDFSKALHRAYQLRDFRATFYVISPLEKEREFRRKISTDPYHEISERIFWRSIDDIFSLYETAIKHSELKEKIIVEI